LVGLSFLTWFLLRYSSATFDGAGVVALVVAISIGAFTVMATLLVSADRQFENILEILGLIADDRIVPDERRATLKEWLIQQKVVRHKDKEVATTLAWTKTTEARKTLARVEATLRHSRTRFGPVRRLRQADAVVAAVGCNDMVCLVCHLSIQLRATGRLWGDSDDR
jgi:hypothetical protein